MRIKDIIIQILKDRYQASTASTYRNNEGRYIDISNEFQLLDLACHLAEFNMFPEVPSLTYYCVEAPMVMGDEITSPLLWVFDSEEEAGYQAEDFEAEVQEMKMGDIIMHERIITEFSRNCGSLAWNVFPVEYYRAKYYERTEVSN